MSTLIIDYGMSNLGSIRRAIEECGSKPIVSDNPDDMQLANHIILPGVGAFPDGMRNLNESGWVPALKKAVENKIPLLGICLGMQLLADKSYEEGETNGLGFISGEICHFVPTNQNEKIPHVGWNDILKKRDSVILKDIPNGADFYFVHSYYFKPIEKSDIVAETNYCGCFASIISKENVFGVQFHPEKSGKMGFKILKNFLDFHKVDDSNA